ncbi:MAG: hypothetical protein ABIT01_11015 [Thermoanaerobaculia bacterium]
MTHNRKLLGLADLLILAGLLGSFGGLQAQGPLAAAQSTELWGGPAAKGGGSSGARFDSNIYISAVLAPASGTVDFYLAGSLVTSRSFSVSTRGVTVLATPIELDGAGAFLYRIRSSSAVSAWSETYNETSTGRFGLSLQAFTSTDFLNPGDEASGGGADASSSSEPGRARTNVGIVCRPGSSQACRIEVTAYQGGSGLGTGTLTADPGSAVQASLATLVPASQGISGLAIQIRLLQGSGQPYAIRNDNRTSDGTSIPLAISRSAFSTAPTITRFDATPESGCSQQNVSLSWATTGAVRVTISGVAGDLPPSGAASVSLQATTDLILTAYSSTGETSSAPRRVTIYPPTEPPTPSPASATTTLNGTATGIIPASFAGRVTAEFTRHESSGSTFDLNGYNWVYIGGATAGTDIVKLTATGNCGTSSATITFTVVGAGAPRIVSFTADPAIACAPANIVLSWQTIDATSVTITGVDTVLAPNGSIGVTVQRAEADVNGNKDFKLIARGANNKMSDTTITVHVDDTLQTPVVSPSNVTVAAGQTLVVTVTNMPIIERVGWVYAQNQSGSTFQLLSQNSATGTSTFRYSAGLGAPTQDIVRISYRNGCGTTYGLFTANVQ